MSQGFTLVHGSKMSADAWQNARIAKAILPDGQVTPGPKVWTGEGDPNADVFRDWIPEAKWTKGMREISEFAQTMANNVLDQNITVVPLGSALSIKHWQKGNV